LELAERGRFCYVCGTRYQAGRRGISLQGEALPTDSLCGFCAAAVAARDRFCSACGCQVASRKSDSAGPPPAKEICPWCGERPFNRRLAIFTLRFPQPIYCPFCGGPLKPQSLGEQHGQEQA
ncbi:MAG: hypothetical protein N3A66_05875, partial [Planctomycetota bacterium]|nr:hypothetical protein [Planctomycetota bacterium]